MTLACADSDGGLAIPSAAIPYVLLGSRLNRRGSVGSLAKAHNNGLASSIPSDRLLD